MPSRSRRWRWFIRLAIVAVVGLSTTQVVPPRSEVLARGEDACRESNDEFQRACFLGREEALGFVSHPGDVDAYRVEAMDYGVRASFELAEMPVPYRLIVADWNGEVIGASSDRGGVEAAEAAFPLPGSYYVFVDSRYGDFSDSVPYRLSAKLAYPYADAGIPLLKWSETFHTAESVQDWNRSTEDAEFEESNGKFTIRVKREGVTQDWQRVASGPFGPPEGLDDFTLTADARVSNRGEGSSGRGHLGYRIGFRWLDPYHQYSVAVDVSAGRAWLNIVNGDNMKSTEPLTEPLRVRAINRSGGVNRTVIRCVGDDIRVSINGEEAIRVRDSTFRAGRYNLVAAGWGSGLSEVKFDNILIQTPTRD